MCPAEQFRHFLIGCEPTMSGIFKSPQHTCTLLVRKDVDSGVLRFKPTKHFHSVSLFLGRPRPYLVKDGFKLFLRHAASLAQPARVLQKQKGRPEAAFPFILSPPARPRWGGGHHITP
jgi:hypothetical protein